MSDQTEFGQQLKQLRRQAGWRQADVAEKINANPAHLISYWERAYQAKDGRVWKPNRAQLVALVKLFAGQLSPAEAQQWAAQAGYRLTRAELDEALGPLTLYPPRQVPPLPATHVVRPDLQAAALALLRKRGRLALIGLGGAGKTTLAAWLAEAVGSAYPDGIIWVGEQAGVSERQRRIAASYGVTLTGLDETARAAELRTLLLGKKCLLVLDDVWYGPDLAGLQVVGRGGGLLVTSRDRKVADVLHLPLLAVSGLTAGESGALLAAWDAPVADRAAAQLAAQLGGLPLALTVLAAQLRAGAVTVEQALASLSLAQLAQDDPQNRSESVRLSFDLSWERLSVEIQGRYAALGVFSGPFAAGGAAAVWALPAAETQALLRHLARLSLIQQEGAAQFSLHPLLRDYSREKLAARPELEQSSRRRHAKYYIGRDLYHPGVLDGVDEPAPPLDESWPEVVAGVGWAAARAPRLAAMAVVLAHTERPALLEAVGPALVAAVGQYAAEAEQGAERALLAEIRGDLQLYQGDFQGGLARFEQAAAAWQAVGQWLASSRALVRAAGVRLLQNEPAAALAAVQRAQVGLEQAAPLTGPQLESWRWLYYWFDAVLTRLVQWPACPLEPVAALRRLAVDSGVEALAGRGWHLERLWWTAPGQGRLQTAADRQHAAELSLRAWRAWRRSGEREKADREITWARYELRGQFGRNTARRYGRRLSRITPVLTAAQRSLLTEAAWRWWLGATEEQRLAWFSRMYPRYVQAPGEKPLHRLGRAWVEAIEGISVIGPQARRLAARGQERVTGLEQAEQLLFSGIIPLPLPAVKQVLNYVAELTAEDQ